MILTKNNWKQSFNAVPDYFCCRVRSTVARLEAAPRRHARLRPAIILAAMLLLLAGTALALSSLGVLDTLTGNLRRFLLPGAARLVQTDISQTAEQPRHAAFTVEQAVNDGHQIYATIRVHGGGGALLMDYNAQAAWGMDWWKNNREDEGQTFSNRAYETGRLLVQAGCDPVDGFGQSIDAPAPDVHYDGEDILYTVTFPAAGEQARLRLSTYEVYSGEKPHQERLSLGTLDFTVPVTEARSLFAADTPIDLPIARLTLTELIVEQTPIATYVTYAYGAGENADDLTLLNLRDGVWVEWLDENGQRYPGGTASQANESAEGGGVRLTAVYRAFEKLPETMRLSFYNGMTKERFDALTTTLHPISQKEDNP